MPISVEELMKIPDFKAMATANIVERKSLDIVYDYEVKQGRDPKAVKNRGFDISSGDRQIEVKGSTGSGGFVSLNYKNIEALRREPNFWLYIVKFDGDKASLIMLNKSQVEERKKPKEQWHIPFWVKDLKGAVQK